jgi:hypothetical protein
MAETPPHAFDPAAATTSGSKNVLLHAATTPKGFATATIRQHLLVLISVALDAMLML